MVWTRLAWAGLAIALGLLYAVGGIVLPRGADPASVPSGVFDMDVNRVQDDLATALPAIRTSIHPLYKLSIAPAVMALRRNVPGLHAPGTALRLVTAAGVLVSALLAGAFARRLCDGAAVPGLLAALLAGTAFSSVLLGSIPETSALSGVATLAPLLLLATRLGRPLTRLEAICWAGVAVLGFSITSSQLVHPLIAGTLRVIDAMRSAPTGPGAALRALLPRLAAATALAAVIVLGCAEWQSQRYPNMQRFWEPPAREGGYSFERRFLRTSAMRREPAAHLTRLVAHFGLLNFVAPMPAYSDFLVARGIPLWSLSLEEAGLAEWRLPQLGLAIGILALLALAARGARQGWREPVVTAAGLSLASQLVLHAIYGREYVLYSGNWTPLVAALAVAFSWRGRPEIRRGIAVLVIALSIGSAANSLVVLDRVYAEVRAGLGTDARDREGRLLHPTF